MFSDGTNTILRPATSAGGTIFFESFAGAIFGGIGAIGLQVGSSVYGPTGASIFGAVAVGGALTVVGGIVAEAGVNAGGQRVTASYFSCAGSSATGNMVGESSYIDLYSFDANNLGIRSLRYDGSGYAPILAANMVDNGSFTVLGNLQCNNTINAETITAVDISAAGEFIGSGAGLNSIPNGALDQTPPLTFNSAGTLIATRIYFGVASVTSGTPTTVSFPSPYSSAGSYIVMVTVENPTPDIGVSIVRVSQFSFEIFVGPGTYAVHWMSMGN
jgi:hypothetical protein